VKISRALLLFGSFLLVVQSALIAGKPTPPPPPPAPHWEYSAAWGGWLDWNTGLVWGQDTFNYFQEIDPDIYAYGSWTYCNTTVLPNYRLSTGFNDWRMATRAEVAQAAANDYYDVVLADYNGSISSPEHTWVADGGGGNWRYYGDLRTGLSVRTIEARSYLNLTPVRRAF
jgi:hypothetical protein